MKKKKILGLDLGTNSIGWALIEIDREKRIVRIIGLGSRILPMDAGEIGKYEAGVKIKSTVAQRTEYRGTRRLNERFILRRDRLHLVLNLLKALPEHYAIKIDFEKNGKRCGQFKENKEPKIAYKPIENSSKYEFYFEDAFNEMIEDLQKVNPNIKNEKGCRIPKDWTLYYLRKKALKEKITLEELAWVLLSYNQKRGYEKLEIEDKRNRNQIEEQLDVMVESVSEKTDKDGRKYYLIQLNDNDRFTYKEYSDKPLTKVGDIKELSKSITINEKGGIEKSKTKYTITDIYSLKIKDCIYQRTDNKSKPHKYEIVFDNGWSNVVEKKNYTYQYEKAKGKSFDYIVKTDFDSKQNIKLQSSKERTFREPDYSEKSRDWTLLKKKTEREAIQFNIENGYVDEKTKGAQNYISPKIYDVLKQDARTGNRTKIIGGMFQVVERKFYREELNAIIKTQRTLHQDSTLNDKKIFEECVNLLYPNNKKHAKNLLKNKKAIQHLLIDDILLYQRDLKSKKSEIADCKYEIRYWEHTDNEEVDKVTGEIKKESIPHYYKAVSSSHPLYQEYRIWSNIHNLRLVQIEKENEKGDLETNVDVTRDYLKTENDYQKLFDLFNNQSSVNKKQFLKFCEKTFNMPKKGIVWNFPEEEELKGNETRVSFAFRFKRCGFVDYEEFLTQEKEIALWHYLYSVNYKERKENNCQSVRRFFTNIFSGYLIDEDVFEKIIEDFSNYPKFDSNYGAYSEKALKKLLPFIRLSGERFKGQFEISKQLKKHLKAIDYKKENIKTYLKLDKENQRERTKEERNEIELLKQEIYEALWKDSVNKRVQQIIDKLSTIDYNKKKIDYSNIVNTDINTEHGELAFPKGLFVAFKDYNNIDLFCGLDVTKASYLVYGRHSELVTAKYWKSPEQIRNELPKELRQHSLNNPIAEKVIREMMQVVADIWEYFGKGEDNYFSEIHLEVGRELKNNAGKKEEYSKKQNINREQNNRLRYILKEFLSEAPYNAKPNNKDHFERLKIVEDSVLMQSGTKGVESLLKEPKISKQQFEKYKLWIDQKYCSPYTGEIIKLSDLFDGDKYNVDHIFPRASVTNDSLSNKVVCETIINKEKGSMTGREFILAKAGEKYNIQGEIVTILDDESYVSLVKKRFSSDKQFILLSKEIPTGFTSSQLNNARYIARKAMELLSHIVREPGEVEYRSKNILPVSGQVTSKLKQAWRLNEVWTDLLTPRFKRLNKLTQSNLFGSEQQSNGHSYFDCNLHDSIRETNPNYDIKRLDHRHHALDALIVALCTEEHVAYFSNVNAGIDPKKRNNKKKLEQIKNNRLRLKRAIMYYKDNDEIKSEEDKRIWYLMAPCSYHDNTIKGYGKNSVINLKFSYQGEVNIYKKSILNALENTIVTFKKKKSPIRKTSNKYYSYYTENGELRVSNNGSPIKKITKQTDENSIKYKSNNKRNIAIRRSMHDEQPYGATQLDFQSMDIAKNLNKRELILDDEIRTRLEDIVVNCDYDLKKVAKEIKEGKLKDLNDNIVTHTAYKLTQRKSFYKIRKSISDIANENHIRKIADIKLQKELLEHVAKYNNDYQEAFGVFGIDDFNKNRKIPVRKVTSIEDGKGRYTLGKKQYKKNHSKLVKGTNHCFVIDRENSKYYTISLKDVIDDYYKEVDINQEMKNETKSKFYLSPGDLVYVPTQEELSNSSFNIDNIDLNRVYKFVNSSGTTANFIPFRVADVIFDYDKSKKNDKEMIKIIENLSFCQMKIKSPQKSKGMVYLENEIGMTSHQNKNTVDIQDYKSIKERCWKLKVDRLGNITEILK